MLQNQIRLKCKMHQGSGALLISARGPAKFNRWRIWSTRAPTVHGVKNAGGMTSRHGTYREGGWVQLFGMVTQICDVMLFLFPPALARLLITTPLGKSDGRWVETRS